MTIRLISCDPSNPQLHTISLRMLKPLASPLHEQSKALRLLLRWDLQSL